MELNQLTGKLAKWVFILQEYDFNIIHKVDRVNQDANGLNWNPSSNEEDTISARWHGEVDLEAMLGWHVFAYLCTLLGSSGDVPQGHTGGGNSQSDDDELKGNRALNIHLDLPIMAYLHVGEILVGLTPKEQDQVVHKEK